MRFVALLRGINVDGNTMINLGELRAMFETLGFDHVVSYINSGNLAFDLNTPPQNSARGEESSVNSELASMIESAIEHTFGKKISVIVRQQRHIQMILERNPFAGQFESHKEMHVLFLREEML